jgi:hypothetical protein
MGFQYQSDSTVSLTSPMPLRTDRLASFFHEKAGMSVFFFLLIQLVLLSRAASVAILPSALFLSEF